MRRLLGLIALLLMSSAFVAGGVASAPAQSAKPSVGPDPLAGQTAWLIHDLAPGYYLAICFFPDQRTRVSHALLGRVGAFTVDQE